ncbi:MAG TPA: hypothetical protein PKH07_18680, partial [bacterium]|nr:hypothetical protein [bacterium]
LFVVAVMGVSAFESREKDGTTFFLYQVPVSPIRMFCAKYLTGLYLTVSSILCITVGLIMLKGTSFLTNVMLPETDVAVPIIWCVYTIAFLVSPMIASDISALGATSIGAALASCLFFSLTLKHPALVTLEETQFWKGSYWRIIFATDLLVTLMILCVAMLLFRRFRCLRLSFRQRAVVLMLLCTAASLWIFCNVFIDFHDLFYLLTTRTKVYVADMETQREILHALAEKVDRYREERYGPSCYDKFLHIFGDYESRKKSPKYPIRKRHIYGTRRSIEEMQWLYSKNTLEQQRIQEYLDGRFHWWEKLSEALSCGAMYQRTVEIVENPNSACLLGLSDVQDCVRDLCTKVLYEYAHGQGDRGLSALGLALRLASECRVDSSSLGESKFFRAVMRNCIEDILWRNPEAEWTATASRQTEA